MVEYRIRSVTLHVPESLSARFFGDLDEYIASLQEAVDAATGETSVSIETARIVVATGDPARIPLDPDSLGEIADQAGVLLSVGSFPSSMVDARMDSLLGLASNSIFYNILLEEPSWNEARAVSRLFHRAAEAEPSHATVFGVNALGRPVVTPYYPLAAPHEGPGLGVSVSLTYPNYLLEAYKRGGFEGLVSAIVEAGRTALEAARLVAESLGGSVLGVDLSVAPWMDESSLALVEYVAGVRMPEPGFLLGIYTVNRALSEASRSLGKAIGFNEVQLPVAEDLKLKKRAAELDTSARDLARFSCLCLAGLDLAVVPASVDGVAGLVLDVAACSRAKDRPLGVRIVPLDDVEPGDKVWLEKFGETPVIPL